MISSIYEVLKPKGLLEPHGFIKEVTAPHWLGLHQLGIPVSDNDLI